ncbi:MAG: site-specific DNA-methyltransferase [Kiritimatiellae bacterium]|nr:site-specific DNA-methyltransferase [Kiritimatiellia bacterium]
MPMLNWMGREKAAKATKDVVMKILREEKSLGYGEATKDNILVHGDNLEALKALLPFYAGEVKCIYIDPPYNTGSAFEHYDDNLEHSTWLNMMYPRLKLLREFLREDGSIWISLDDGEAHYCKVLCDEILGRRNFIADVAWEKSDSPRMDAKLFSTRYDHTLVYAKNITALKINKVKVDEIPEHYDKVDKDGRRYYLKPLRAMGQNDGREDRPNLYYAMIAPDGTEIYPIRADGSDGNWRWSKEKVTNNPTYIEWVKGRKGWSPYYKIYADANATRPPETLWSFSFAGSNRNSKSEQAALFGTEDAFTTPKPERLVQRILEIATDEGDLVMDSFLGSGTTAAVAHKMGRRWIGIEMGDHAKTHCAVRMRKVVDGEQGGISKAVKWNGGGGFRFYELGEPLLDERGQIAESISYDVLAAHIWWQDTGTAWGAGKGAKGTVLGVHDGVAYALLYNGILHDRSVNGGNVLTRQTLCIIKDDLGQTEYRKLVVYGEWNKLGEERLKDEKIEFRQTPYDVVTRR